MSHIVLVLSHIPLYKAIANSTALTLTICSQVQKVLLWNMYKQSRGKNWITVLKKLLQLWDRDWERYKFRN